MNGSEWLASLPEQPGAERDHLILEAISSGLAHCQWLAIFSSIPHHTASFYVSDDAMFVELEDQSRFRFTVSAALAQQCADLVSASLLTTKISDLAYQQATILLPATVLPPGPDMSTTTQSKAWNRILEQHRAGREGLLRDCGKAWILSNTPNAGAVNYGFYDSQAPYTNRHGIKMWQTLGTKHNAWHVDYSQTLLLMQEICVVDGEATTVTELLQDPELCSLISDEGVIHTTKQKY